MRERLSLLNPARNPLRRCGKNPGITQLPLPVNRFILGISVQIRPTLESVMHNTALIIKTHKPERDLLQHFLADAGYHVLPTKSSDEALALCRDYKRNIHLLVTDADVPSSSAWDLAERAEALRPGIVVLYLSGSSSSSDISGGLFEPKSQRAGAQAFARTNMLLDVTEALIHTTQQKVQ